MCIYERQAKLTSGRTRLIDILRHLYLNLQFLNVDIVKVDGSCRKMDPVCTNTLWIALTAVESAFIVVLIAFFIFEIYFGRKSRAAVGGVEDNRETVLEEKQEENTDGNVVDDVLDVVSKNIQKVVEKKCGFNKKYASLETNRGSAHNYQRIVFQGVTHPDTLCSRSSKQSLIHLNYRQGTEIYPYRKRPTIHSSLESLRMWKAPVANTKHYVFDRDSNTTFESLGNGYEIPTAVYDSVENLQACRHVSTSTIHSRCSDDKMISGWKDQKAHVSKYGRVLETNL